MKASVTETFSAPKNSGRVLGSAILRKMVIFDAPEAAQDIAVFGLQRRQADAH